MDRTDTEDQLNRDEVSSYRVCFESGLKFVLEHHEMLFTTKDLDTIHVLLHLSHATMCLLSRIIARKSIWLRVSSFLKYIPSIAWNASNTSNISISSEGIIQHIKILSSLEVIEIFGEKINNSGEIGKNIAVYDEKEIRDVLHDTLRMEEIKGLCKIFDIKVEGSREQSLFTLLKKLSLQRTIMSKNSLIQRIPLCLKSILKPPLSIKNDSCYDNRLNMIIRVNPMIIRLIRRAQRLVQISSKIPMSVTSPMNVNSPLLVAFKKVRYVNYKCNIEVSLFDTKQRFEQYETANEFLFLWEMAKSVDKIRYSEEEEEEEKKNEKEKEKEFITSNIEQKIDKLQQHVYNTIKTFEFSQLIGKESETGHLPLSDIISTYFQNLHLSGFISCELLIGLVCTLCYIRYCHLCDTNEILNSKNRMLEDAEYLCQFDPGYLLAQQVFEFISMIERESYGRNYDLAILLLELLLHRNHMPQRKGKLYIRLVIDYDHLGNNENVENVLRRGIADSSVKYSDRLNLEKRWNSYKGSFITSNDSISFNSQIQSNSLVQFNNSIDIYHIEKEYHRLVETYYFHFNSQENEEFDSSTFNLQNTDQLSTIDCSGVVDLTEDEMDKNGSSWSCNLCTLINQLPSLVCEICESPRELSIDNSRFKSKSISKPSFKTNSISSSSSSRSDSVKINNEKKTESQAGSVSKDFKIQNKNQKKTSDQKRRKLNRESKSGNNGNNSNDNDNNNDDIVNANIFNKNSNDNDEDKDDDVMLQLDPNLMTKLKEFTIWSRRFGDTKMKYGKSKFYGSDDELVHVEQFILNKCYCIDDDDMEYTDYICAIDHGYWQGWHCEGSYLRSLYGLLFWDVIFYDKVPNTFLTPYQECPLDFGYPSFFTSRESMIMELITGLENMSNLDFIQMIGDRYRRYYRTECTLVNWYQPLCHIQLIGICIGTKALAKIFLQISKSYRHYRSGMPDLLLIRVKKIFLDSDNKEIIEYVDIKEFLGENWQEKPSKITGSNNQSSNSEVYSTKNRIMALDNNLMTDAMDAMDGTQDTDLSMMMLEDTQDTQDTMADSVVEDLMPVLTTMKTKTRFDKFLCQEKDIILPKNSFYKVISGDITEDSTSKPINEHSEEGSQNKCNHDCFYVYESMFIEVKGPSDILSDKQVIWLSTLSEAGIRAYVGRVKETKLPKR